MNLGELSNYNSFASGAQSNYSQMAQNQLSKRQFNISESKQKAEQILDVSALAGEKPIINTVKNIVTGIKNKINNSGGISSDVNIDSNTLSDFGVGDFLKSIGNVNTDGFLSSVKSQLGNLQDSMGEKIENIKNSIINKFNFDLFS